MKKWCPFIRFIKIVDGIMDNRGHVIQTKAELYDKEIEHSICIEEKCALWVYDEYEYNIETKELKFNRGRCGLINKGISHIKYEGK